MGNFYGDDFPYVFGCIGCGAAQEVTWYDTLYFASCERIPPRAARKTLRVFGWYTTSAGPICRECMETVDHLKDQL